MKEIHEILLKFCNKIHKASSIKLLDDCIKISFYCSNCRKWLHLEIKNGMKKMLFDIDSIKTAKKLPYRYIKANRRFADGKSVDFPNNKKQRS